MSAPLPSSRKRICALAVLFAGLTLGCQYLNRATTEVADEPAGCLDDANALRDRDFALKRQLEARLRAALNGVIHLADASRSQADELSSLCIGLARDLGVSKPDVAESVDPQARSQLVCEKAIDKIGQIRQAAEANLTVELPETRCAGRLDSYASCARACDADLPPGKVNVECAPSDQWGRCGGKCDGQCVQRFADCNAACDGRCEGTCTEDFYGSCGGRCVGTCDLQDVNGRCEGQCDGKCLSEASGTCGGQCRGKCHGACVEEVKKRSCDGICVGECDSAMPTAHCAEMIAPAEMVPACRAMCEAEQLEQLVCLGGRARVSVYFANDTKAAEQLRDAVDRRVQELFELAQGVTPKVDAALSAVAASVDEVTAELDDAREKKTVGTCLSDAEAKHEQVSKDFAAIRETAEALLGSLQG